MDRRTFLKVAAMTGLAVSAPLGVRRAFAEPAPYKGPFFVLVNASGGWDPVYLCDPKPKGPLNRRYDAPASVGKINYAPIGIDDASLGLDATRKWPGETSREWSRPIVPDVIVGRRMIELWDRLMQESA